MEVAKVVVESNAYYGNVYTGESFVEDNIYMETENTGISSNVILWITIGVCAVIGIALGIILGRRSAMK